MATASTLARSRRQSQAADAPPSQHLSLSASPKLLNATVRCPPDAYHLFSTSGARRSVPHRHRVTDRCCAHPAVSTQLAIVLIRRSTPASGRLPRRARQSPSSSLPLPLPFPRTHTLVAVQHARRFCRVWFPRQNRRPARRASGSAVCCPFLADEALGDAATRANIAGISSSPQRSPLARRTRRSTKSISR